MKFLRTLLPIAAMTTPLVIQLLYINQFAVNVPVGDEWALAHDVRAFELGAERFRDVWRQHNEHRMLFPRLALLVTARLSSWNVVAELYVSVLFVSITLAAWWLLYRRVHPSGLLAFIPIPWLLYSVGQWENVLTGWQLQFYLGVAASVWCLCLLSRDSWPSLVGAAGCGTVASYSFNNGLVMWPVGLAVLAATRMARTRMAFWGVTGALVTVGYYYGYHLPENHPSPWLGVQHPFETLTFFVANVGAPLAAGNLALSYITGTYVIALLATHVIRTTRRHSHSSNNVEVVLGGLVLVSLFSSLAIAFGRVGFHQPSWATSSRYVTVATMGIAGTYLLLLRGGTSRTTSGGDQTSTHIQASLFTLIVVGVGLSVPWGFSAGRDARQKRLELKYVVQTFLLQQDEAFESLTVAGIIREHAPFMQSRRLSVFKDPVPVLSLTTFERGLPAGEIVAGRPVVQQLTCPVDTLKDMQILFATYGRTNTARVEIELTDGSRTIFSRSIASNTLEDNDWFKFDVSPPFERCAGRDLTLSVRSPDGRHGNAVTVWTYPRYYYGTLLAPADPVYADRGVGLMMNVAHFKLATN